MRRQIYPLIVVAIMLVHGKAEPRQETDRVAEITFISQDASAFDALKAIAIQARIPMGIELGEAQSALCKRRREYTIVKQRAIDAAIEALRGTDYSVKQENGVILVIAEDLTFKDQTLLNYRYRQFPGSNPSTMVGLGAELTAGMQMELEHVTTFAASIERSSSAEEITLGDVASGSTEEIANRIVKSGKGGVWIFRESSPDSQRDTRHEVAIYSYADDLTTIMQLSCARSR